MATYKEIEEEIQKKHQITVKSCWIADIKRQYGLTTRIAYNRIDPRRVQNPCPECKREFIVEAFKWFRMIKSCRSRKR
jgi:hypothetical protein